MRRGVRSAPRTLRDFSVQQPGFYEGGTLLARDPLGVAGSFPTGAAWVVLEADPYARVAPCERCGVARALGEATVMRATVSPPAAMQAVALGHETAVSVRGT